MAKFLVYVEQSGGGCDCTIGCGVKVGEVFAESADFVAHSMLRSDRYGDPSSHGPKGHAPLKRMTIYEVTATTSVNLADHWRACEERDNEAKRVANDAMEQAEWERLRAKFGGV